MRAGTMKTHPGSIVRGDAGQRREGNGGRWPMPGLRACACLLAMCGLAQPFAARAASTASCQVDTSAAEVAFGTYDPISALPLDATGTIDVVCDKNNTALVVALDRGQGGSYLPRKMQSGAQVLPYNLYTDPARSTVFGDGTGGTSIGAGTTSSIGGGQFRARVFVYGRMPPGMNVAEGSYSDRITVSVVF